MRSLRNSQFIRRPLSIVVGSLALVFVASPSAMAALAGTTPTAPGATVFPGLTLDNPGTLLATVDKPFSGSSTAGTTSGFLVSAVYREAGGTLDFYYQIQENGGSTTNITGNSNTSFSPPTLMTNLGFRIDGSTLAGTAFVDGTQAPTSGDRQPISTGSTVDFLFSGLDAAQIHPGQASNVLAISTNAINFTTGNSQVIFGGVAQVDSFQPAPVPEPASLALIGGGLFMLAGARKFAKRH